MDISALDTNKINTMGDSQFQAVMRDVMKIQSEDRKECALRYYVPVSKYAREIHLATETVIGVGGGNGSSKTETCLAEMMMLATGITPDSLIGSFDPYTKFRGPVNCRVVCESLTNVLHQIILPKLQWWQWTGHDMPGGVRGHWGWVPRDSLIGGLWDKSWREKDRVLRVLYRDPEDYKKVIGESRISFMSHDQDASDFASGDFHMILMDEPPKHAIWKECEARTMRVGGRLFLAMTWPDDPAIPVDWLFDKVYEPAQSGVDGYKWFNLFTTDNPNLDQDAVAKQMEKWDDQTTRVRILGQPIRFSNRVHQNFTDQDQVWCFSCGDTCIEAEGACVKCQSSTITHYNHVREFTAEPNWPTLFLLDPHPRKPHMASWWQVDPNSDLWCVGEMQCAGDPTDVYYEAMEFESRMGLTVTFRYIDPNMGRSPASARRGVTWQDEFEKAGLYCDLADDAASGRQIIDTYLKPNRDTLQPRIHFHPRCDVSILQMKRHVWADYKEALEKAQKQVPKDKDDDFPTLLKYLVNTEPTFTFCTLGAPVIRRMGVGNGRR